MSKRRDTIEYYDYRLRPLSDMTPFAAAEMVRDYYSSNQSRFDTITFDPDAARFWGRSFVVANILNFGNQQSTLVITRENFCRLTMPMRECAAAYILEGVGAGYCLLARPKGYSDEFWGCRRPEKVMLSAKPFIDATLQALSRF